MHRPNAPGVRSTDAPRGRLWGALLLVTVVAACSPSRFAPPPDALTAPEPLLERVRAREAAVTSLVAEARVEYYGEDGVRKGRIVVAARRPASVRFEAESPTGDFLALLVSDGDEFVSFQRGEDRCYVGPSCSTNVGRLLPIALPGDQVVRVLLGEGPIPSHESATLAFNERTGRYDLTLESPARRERVRISYDTSDLAARTVAYWRDNALLFRVAYDDLQRHGDVRLPTRIRFRMPSRSVDLSLKYRDVELDPEGLDESNFRYVCPAGTERWVLPCDGGAPARAEEGSPTP